MTKTVAQGPNRRGEPTREKVEQPSEKVEQPSEISLSVPWITGSSNINIANVFQDGRGNDEIMGMFIKERTRVHETYIKEQGRIKTFGFGISAIMFIISGAIIVFAPPERTILAYAVAGVLIIAAAGVAGFTAVQMKALGLRLGQSDGGSQRVRRSRAAGKS